MKKLMSFLLALVMVFGLMGSAPAEGAPTFVISEATAAAGETVRVTISIENNPGVCSIRLYPQYDADVLE